MLDSIREAFNAAFGSRDSLSLMREAVIEAKAALQQMREGVARTEQALARERRHLEDATRRGRLAGDIGDEETVQVASEFAEKHRKKVEVLERKLKAQRDELALAEKEVDDMTRKLKGAARGAPPGGSVGTRAESESRLSDDLGAALDRRARESFAEAQLEELKKKMGRG